ncbi:histidine kinase [candidate division KSB1 bacterium]|nr:histidine kinase [candidate division KSB1 bacterium]
MHPLLAEKRWFGLYLAAWLLAAALLAALVKFMGNLAWEAALALALPLALLYAFLCLPAWYLCRAFPLSRTAPSRLVTVHLLAAAVTSALWVTLGTAWSALLARFSYWLNVEAEYLRVMPVFAGVGLLLFWLSVVGHYLVIAFEEARLTEKQALEFRIHAREAELKALRAQIDPHFLFNSLNSISALTSANPAAARRMCLGLADFLRQTLQRGAQNHAIEQVRFGARLQVKETIAADSKPCFVPPLVLQPLLENAINHGIAHLVEGGTITLAAQRNGGRLQLAVENPCDPDRPRSTRPGIGLENVKQRLLTLFGTEARVDILENAGRFRVELSLPALT